MFNILERTNGQVICPWHLAWGCNRGVSLLGHQDVAVLMSVQLNHPIGLYEMNPMNVPENRSRVTSCSVHVRPNGGWGPISHGRRIPMGRVGSKEHAPGKGLFTELGDRDVAARMTVEPEMIRGAL